VISASTLLAFMGFLLGLPMWRCGSEAHPHFLFLYFLFLSFLYLRIGMAGPPCPSMLNLSRFLNTAIKMIIFVQFENRCTIVSCDSKWLVTLYGFYSCHCA
jgi:hypothetical protein